MKTGKSVDNSFYLVYFAIPKTYGPTPEDGGRL